jgi:hypothetical protein
MAGFAPVGTRAAMTEKRTTAIRALDFTLPLLRETAIGDLIEGIKHRRRIGAFAGSRYRPRRPPT